MSNTQEPSARPTPKIEPAEGKLGILIPGMGAVATTFIAGVEAIKQGLAQLMCVFTLDHRFGLTTFLSVYRRALDKPFTKEDANTMHFQLTMKPNEVRKVTYTVETQW